MKVHHKVREDDMSNSVCIEHLHTSANIYLAFMSRDKGELFVLLFWREGGDFTIIHLVYIVFYTILKKPAYQSS